jgi:hypothetical protein
MAAGPVECRACGAFVRAARRRCPECAAPLDFDREVGGGELGDIGIVVAGGDKNRYLVVAQEPGRYFYLARRPAPARPGELIEVMVGGLPAFYPRAIVHSLPAALAAVEHYFRTGRRARKLSWMRGEVAERLRRHAEDERWRRRTSDNGR